MTDRTNAPAPLGTLVIMLAMLCVICTNRRLGMADEPEASDEKKYDVTTPPAELNLVSFYKKYLDASGYPIVSSDKVNDYALKEAAYLVDMMLSERPDLRKAMIASGSRLIVIAHSEFTTDIPEYSQLKPKDYWDARARGLINLDSTFSSAQEQTASSREPPNPRARASQ